MIYCQSNWVHPFYSGITWSIFMASCLSRPVVPRLAGEESNQGSWKVTGRRVGRCLAHGPSRGQSEHKHAHNNAQTHAHTQKHVEFCIF